MVDKWTPNDAACDSVSAKAQYQHHNQESYNQQQHQQQHRDNCQQNWQQQRKYYHQQQQHHHDQQQQHNYRPQHQEYNQQQHNTQQQHWQQQSHPYKQQQHHQHQQQHLHQNQQRQRQQHQQHQRQQQQQHFHQQQQHHHQHQQHHHQHQQQHHQHQQHLHQQQQHMEFSVHTWVRPLNPATTDNTNVHLPEDARCPSAGADHADPLIPPQGRSYDVKVISVCESYAVTRSNQTHPKQQVDQGESASWHGLTDSHTQWTDQEQSPHHLLPGYTGPHGPAPGTSPEQGSMMSPLTSSLTCMEQSRQNTAANVPTFPRWLKSAEQRQIESPLYQTSHPQGHQDNFQDHHPKQSQSSPQRMARRTGENKPWFASSDRTWSAPRAAEPPSAPGQPFGAGPGPEQRAGPSVNRGVPRQEYAASWNRGHHQSASSLAQCSLRQTFMPTSPNKARDQARDHRPNAVESQPMTFSRMTSPPRCLGQLGGGHHLSQSAGNLRRPCERTARPRRTSDSEISVKCETGASNMYRTGETCTINPIQYGGFGQELKPTELNTSGDFINFDFITPLQLGDLFSYNLAGFAEEPSEMEYEKTMPVQVNPHKPIKIEEAESAGGVMGIPPQSQYDEDMDQVQRLIVREVMGDIMTACQLIDIPTDPYSWNSEQVQKWVEWTRHQYRLPEIDTRFFAMDGKRLCNLTDEQFRQILPKSGDILFAHLDIWKNASRMNIADDVLSPDIPKPQRQVDESFSFMEIAGIGDYESSSTGSNSDDEASISSPLPTGPNTIMTPNHTGSIHLWQFLKELLLQPDSYGYCIRWMDRTQGIFKIEDSVEVARLWGMRKNRPAMNYDKLSRSIRQYYKKGIMKKTEIAQRLVYQFVHPC